MSDLIECPFGGAAAQAQAATDRLAGQVAADGGALVLTGGNTVGPVFDALSRRPLPWRSIDLVLTDERWVATADEQSNERQIRQRLMTGPASMARLTSLKTDHASPEDALVALEARVAALPRPFAATLVGMGEDGHIASLFPGVASPADLDVDGPSLVAAGRAPNGMARLSLTMRALLDTRLVLVLVRGEAKRELLRGVWAGASPDLPIAELFRQARSPVEVYWAP